MPLISIALDAHTLLAVDTDNLPAVYRWPETDVDDVTRAKEHAYMLLNREWLNGAIDP